MDKKPIHRDELDQSLGADPQAYARRTGRDELEKRFSEASKRLPRDGGAIDPTILEDRNCPLCGEIESHHRHGSYGFSIQACGICGFEFIRPILSPAFAHTEAGKAWHAALSVDHLAFITREFYRRCAALRFEFELQHLLRHVPDAAPPEHFIEIGASVGIGLTVARDYGLTPVGIEPDAEAFALAKQTGAEVHHAFFPMPGLQQDHFDIAMSLDVLEHIAEPVEFLLEIRKLLKPGGLVGIQVPNAAALITRIEGYTNQIYNGLIHVNYFDPKSLDQMAEVAGLEKVHTFTFLSELGKCRSYDPNLIASLLKASHPHLDPFQALHQDWINDEGLGYKVFGIYRRPQTQ
ncbi:class I SAM-dependent methyltransferase [Acanthopleuribacter pedis]|uniref:Class I SAM-dependent methyltransferase n=1 Tax=Acanthopleuribacter pedis TaxID=442870 RepID=A0A8J7QPQ5_9BACT|nr:class I SAM-dependent methyltransferase [Acanthopleuribacter pedis]MBO1321850.1 class I SAM-dependent methyltransferase [Acanthopleuribacter pedis]